MPRAAKRRSHGVTAADFRRMLGSFTPGSLPERLQGEADAVLFIWSFVRPAFRRDVLERLKIAAAAIGRRAVTDAPPVGPPGGYVLHFDGGCWPNPGGRAAYGWHIDTTDGRQVAEGRGEVTDALTSNNVAEWRGLEAGLLAFSRITQDGRPVAELVIRGDSQLVLYQLVGRWAVKAEHLRPLRDTCRMLLNEMPYPWRAEWVPRAQNARADALCGIVAGCG